MRRKDKKYKECKVIFEDGVNVGFEIKATTFKPSRMKEKQELRRAIEKNMEER